MATNKYITDKERLNPEDLKSNGSRIGGDMSLKPSSNVGSKEKVGTEGKTGGVTEGGNVGASLMKTASLQRAADVPTSPEDLRKIQDIYRTSTDKKLSVGGGTDFLKNTTSPVTNPVINTAPPTGIANPTQEVTGGTDGDPLRNKIEGFIENPVLPDAAKQTVTPMVPQDNEFIDSSGDAYNISKEELNLIDAEMKAELAQTGAVSPTTAAKYEAAQASYNQATEVIKGKVSQTVNAVKGELSDDAFAEAAIQDLDKIDPKTLIEAETHEVPNGATVKGQLDGLLESLKTGEVPEWAKPAVAQAESMLAARGMSSSSVGQQALFNSIISSAMPIAQQDAKAKLSVFQQDISNEQQAKLANSQFFQNLTMQNLSNKQQTALSNAATVAQMDMANADRAQQAQISNAQLFLQMDIANMNNQQQAAMLDSQQRQQTMLSNQAAENAAKQFNASSQQQADQFNSNLAAQVEQFNVQQQNAMNQFNTEKQFNAQQFNSQLDFNREQFNAQNATAIEQSNVQWRRQTNQINTAAINAVNQANAMNAFNLSNQALTFLWQENRDKAKWAFEGAENEEERKVRMAIAALSNESMQDSEMANNITSLARAAASIFDSWGD